MKRPLETRAADGDSGFFCAKPRLDKNSRRQQYIEVGRKSALLSVGVDWIVFPQAGRSSLEAVFTEVDAFLANTRQASAQLLAQR